MERECVPRKPGAARPADAPRDAAGDGASRAPSKADLTPEVEGGQAGQAPGARGMRAHNPRDLKVRHQAELEAYGSNPGSEFRKDRGHGQRRSRAEGTTTAARNRTTRQKEGGNGGRNKRDDEQLERKRQRRGHCDEWRSAIKR